MTRWLKIKEKINPSKKERAIISEIRQHGYHFGYSLASSRKYLRELTKIYPEYCFLQSKWENYRDNRVLAITIPDESPDESLVVVFYPSLRHAIKSNSSATKERITEIEVIVHELSHVILYQHSKDLSLKEHGSRFKQVYTKMCLKYKIRYPDDRYFIDPE